MLLGSHDSFRKTSATLCRRARRGSDAAAIMWVFRVWKGSMRSHERYEEVKLDPYLTARWGLCTDPAEEGHERLSELETDVYAAFDATDGPATPALADALDAHHAELLHHLALEEEMVIPGLLALSPREFERYYHGSVRSLLAELGGESPTTAPGPTAPSWCATSRA